MLQGTPVQNESKVLMTIENDSTMLGANFCIRIRAMTNKFYVSWIVCLLVVTQQPCRKFYGALLSFISSSLFVTTSMTVLA